MDVNAGFMMVMVVGIIIVSVIATGTKIYKEYTKSNQNQATKKKTTKPQQQAKGQQSREYKPMESTMTNNMTSRLVKNFSTIDTSAYDNEENFYDTEESGEFHCTCVDTDIFNEDMLYSVDNSQGEQITTYHLDNIAAAIILGDAIGKAKYRRSRR